MKKLTLIHLLLLITATSSFVAKADCADSNNCDITNTWITYKDGRSLTIEKDDKSTKYQRHYFGPSGGTVSTDVFDSLNNKVGQITACITPDPASLKVSPSSACSISCEYTDLKSGFTQIGYKATYQKAPKNDNGYEDNAKVEQYLIIAPLYMSGDGIVYCEKVDS